MYANQEEIILRDKSYSGDYYGLVNILNSFEFDDLEAISANTYDVIIENFENDPAQKGPYVTFSALHVFYEQTKQFLPRSTKLKTAKLLMRHFVLTKRG